MEAMLLSSLILFLIVDFNLVVMTQNKVIELVNNFVRTASLPKDGVVQYFKNGLTRFYTLMDKRN